MFKGLDFFFNPGSIAIVGATDKPGKISSIVLESLKSSGYPGKIFPVNPNYASVGGLRSYPSITDINEPVDLAVIAVPAAKVASSLKDAAGKLKGAVVISGGFSETGQKGRALERELKETARREEVRIIGPNCMGIFDTVSRVDTFFIPSSRVKRPIKGGLSIVSQSGSFAITAMDELAAEGIGVARVVSYGNRADVSEADCLEFLAEDDETTAVALYIESIDEGRRFVEAASKCSLKKPVMAIKVGKYGAGAAAARSHTGAIAGRHEVYRAAFKKAGIIELEGYEDFLAGCKAFGRKLPLSGNRVMIITDGGGIGVSIADACYSAGLDVPPLDEQLKDELSMVFPSYFAIGNPMDLTGSATDELYADALETALESHSCDIAIVAALWGPPGLTDNLVDMIAERAKAANKPVLICSPGGDFTRKRNELFKERNMPVFTTPEAAVTAASLLAKAAMLKVKR